MVNIRSAGEFPGASETTGVYLDTLFISTSQPVLTIRHVPDGIPEVLEIDVTVVENDSLINFFIEVFIIAPDRDSVRIGTVTPFPIDAWGRFILGVDAAVEKLRRGPEEIGEPLALQFMLRQENLNAPVIVHIDSVNWFFPDS